MRQTLTVLLMLARVLGIEQMLTGFGLWFGGFSNRALHTGLGSLFVLVTWIIAVIALFALPKRGVALFALAWGALVLWFGMAQTTLLVGSAHWTVRIAHLLMAAATLGIIEALVKSVKLHVSAREV
jgi:hypothetical protein